jgi:3-hydroxyisobutyrate dehydrogenase-like beta-hydroxyacid dehydrogenase
MRVAFLGLGEMGGPMASFVIAAGHEVALYDPVRETVDARSAGGARAARSPADAATDAEVVCVVVRDDHQSIAAVDGDDGALRGAAPGCVVVLHATVAPETVRRLARACAEAGMRFVDAGISGGAAGAQAGTLYVMCGGDADAIEVARPVLESYARHIVRFGGTGAGMAAKLARNLVHYSVWVAVHEGMALAEAAGLDLRDFEHLVNESGVPDLVRLQLAKDTAAPIDAGEDAARLAWLRKTVELGWKDLDDAFELANEVGVAVDMAAVARRHYGASMNYPV